MRQNRTCEHKFIGHANLIAIEVIGTTFNVKDRGKKPGVPNTARVKLNFDDMHWRKGLEKSEQYLMMNQEKYWRLGMRKNLH